MEPMNSRESCLIRFISRATYVIRNDDILWHDTFESKRLKESFLNSIIPTVITPGHDLISFFKRNIDICTFFERVKHVTDNSKKRL